jgi:hypothetical protein
MHHAQVSPPATSKARALFFFPGVAMTFTLKVRTTWFSGTLPLPKLTVLKRKNLV